MQVDATWLRQLGEEGLAMLLTRRPETLEPAPPSLTMLAARLQQGAPVSNALRRLNRPTLQVAEAIAALGGSTTRTAVSRLLGEPEPAELDPALTSLTEHGLLTVDDAQLSLVRAGRGAWATPLGLGPSILTELADLSTEEMRQILWALDRPTPTKKAELKAALAAVLGDRERIRSMVDNAPPDTAAMLRKMAETGAMIRDPGIWQHDLESPVAWAFQRLLIVPMDDWGGVFGLPAEVGLALRGPDYTAPFDPAPPACPRATADEAVVARAASAAAAGMLRLVTNILDVAGRTRVATVRTGGVGVRELKRLAKANGVAVREVKLALALSHGAGLLGAAWSGDAGTPTDRYDEWLGLEPADRYASLVKAWWHLPYCPSETEEAWLPAEEHDGTAWLRDVVLRVAAEPGAITDLADFAGVVIWHRPYAVRRDVVGFASCVVACLSEATMLGLSAKGTVSEAGRALLAYDEDGSLDRLAAALGDVGEVVRLAHLQADLSAVVPGTPSPRLAGVLDSMADREAGSAASTWRFSPTSVRRAMDTGRSADDLLADLASIATTVPQTLEYLVKDVARQHGSVRVSTAAACLRSDDTALLTLMVADKRLKALRLRLLAPTVVVSAVAQAETLAALRKAGYFPVEEGADGRTVVTEVTRRRTERPMARVNARTTMDHELRRAANATEPSSAARTLARALLNKPDGVGPARQAPIPRAEPDGLYQLDVLPEPEPEPRYDGPPWQRYGGRWR